MNFIKQIRNSRVKKASLKMSGIALLGRSIKNIAVDFLDPKIACFQILKYSPAFRSKNEVAKTLPFLSTLSSLRDYFTISEREVSNYEKILNQIGLHMFYQSYKQNFVLKRLGEKNNYFYIVLDGTVTGLQPEFYKECLTPSEYLTYLLKLELLNEKGLISKIKSINHSVYNVNCSVEQYCQKHREFSYETIYKDVFDELSQKYNVNIETYCSIVPSISTYIEMTAIDEDRPSKQKVSSMNDKIYLLLPKYKVISFLKEGDFIGNIIKKTKNLTDDYTFITTQSGIGILDKTQLENDYLFNQMSQVLKKVFPSFQKQFFIFQGIEQNTFAQKYAKYFSFKRYRKGDILFQQGTLNQGLYLLVDGTVQISSQFSFGELDSLMVTLQHSLDYFPNFYSKLSQEKIPLDDLSTLLLNPVYKSDEFHRNAKGKKTIYFAKISHKAVLGLNELYDPKTELYNFECECLTDVHCFEISKEFFNYILQLEPSVTQNTGQIIENRAKYYIHATHSFKQNTITQLSQIIDAKKDMKKSTKNLTLKKSVPTLTINSVDSFPRKYNTSKRMSISIINGSTTSRGKISSIMMRTMQNRMIRDQMLTNTESSENDGKGMYATLQTEPAFKSPKLILKMPPKKVSIKNDSSLYALPPINKRANRSCKFVNRFGING